MEFLISLDHEKFDHKPSSNKQYKDKIDRFGNPRTETSVLGSRVGINIEKLDIHKLGKSIEEGQTWTPYIFQVCPEWNRRRRLEGLFESSQVFALDFDNNESLDYILKKASELNIDIALIHTSFSSTPEYQKSRAIILCDEKITDFLEVKRISLGLAYGFDSDKSCVDIARLYFGSKSNSIIYINDVCTSKKNLLNLASTYNVDRFISKKSKNIEKPDELIWGDLDTQQKIFFNLSKRKLNSLKRIIAGNINQIKYLDEDAKTSRYEIVWKNTARLARMPELTGIFISSLVKDAIQNNSYFSDWEYSADSVINSAISWAANHSDEPI